MSPTGSTPLVPPPSDNSVSIHDDLVGQPHNPATDGPVAQAEIVAEQISTDQNPTGTLGKPFNWRSPFFIAVAATAGVALTYAALQVLLLAGDVFILIGVALFLAVGNVIALDQDSHGLPDDGTSVEGPLQLGFAPYRVHDGCQVIDEQLGSVRAGGW